MGWYENTDVRYVLLFDLFLLVVAGVLWGLGYI